MTRILATTALALSAPAAALAQQYTDAGTFTLEGWNYDALYATGSWNVEDLLDRRVTGLTGEEIGEVEDLVFNDRGELLALVAEIGGIWDIADTHVSVPWQDVEIPKIGPVGVPVTEDSVDQFSVFDYSGLAGTEIGDKIVADVEQKALHGGIWRASDMLGDFVRIQDADEAWMNFGYVTDLVVQDAMIRATVVNTDPAIDGGVYAYPPYVGQTGTEAPANWVPHSATYDMPILRGDASTLPSFEIDKVGGQ